MESHRWRSGAGFALREDDRGEPLIDGSVAWLGCVARAEHEAGDHTIFVGEVEWLELGTNAPALVYYRSEYRSVE